MKNNCKNCSKFIYKDKEFCNDKCKESFEKREIKEVRCLICDKHISDGITQGDQERKTCSLECRDILRKQDTHEIRNCKVCGKEFEIRKKRKKTMCSDECRIEWSARPENKEYRLSRTKEELIKKYGVDSIFKLEEVQRKIHEIQRNKTDEENTEMIAKVKQTKLERHGDENFNNMEKNRQTKLENWGDENWNNREQFLETLEKRYGGHHLKLEEFMEKQKQTNLDRFGVEFPMQNEDIRNKQIKTTFENHGVSSYTHTDEYIIKTNKTNQEKRGVDWSTQCPDVINKMKETNLERHGVINTFQLPQAKSNGKQISKVQIKLYEQIKEKHPDAILEHYLTDVNLSVDIFIPSENKVVECYGDWWHCNPKLYKEDYYHEYIHKTAKEVWNKDKLRENLIKNNGYGLEIVWECDI
ncbi:hypothetical protein COB55_04445 [Candidatus Wolfebacteria bacterium]|nr:MAG: hypothetical protein COB55_04445 [Candidatus Wolfebacteria bacterium]